MLKTAWTELAPDDPDRDRYYTRRIVEKGVSKTLGLVGLHIAHKVAESTQWVWSSFEHVANAPSLDPATGRARLEPGVSYRYFDPARNDPALYNQYPTAAARAKANGRIGTQVVQVLPTEASTQRINQRFYNLIRQANRKSVWLNYRLVGTQWPFSPNLFTNGKGYTPTLLANAVIETYHQKTSSCMGCHRTAVSGRTARFNGYLSDFVWGLADAK